MPREAPRGVRLLVAALVGAGVLVFAPAALALAPVPNLTNLPSISGSPEQGQAISCSSGGWTNLPTSYTYTWKSGVTTVQADTTSATSDSYTLHSSDVGTLVTCTVGASNSDGSSLLTMTSAAVTPVALPTVSVPVLTAVPTISGSPEQGQSVSCSAGSWSNTPTSYAYTWQRNGADITGATGSTYTLTSSDVGQAIACAVTAVNGAGAGAPGISVPIIPVALPVLAVPIETVPPIISGSPEQGQTVTCSTGSWTNSPTSYAYTWQRTGSNIPGATSSSYALTGSDVTHALTCTVIAHNNLGDSAPAISPPIVPVALPVVTVPVETAPPSITGTPQPGQTVTCSPGSWTNSPTSYAYTWQRTGTNITGATSSSYTLTTSDVNQAVSCTVTAHNASGDSASAISLPILPVGSSGPGSGGSGAGGTGGTGGGTGATGSIGGMGGSGGSGGKLSPPVLSRLGVTPSRIMVMVSGKRRSTKGASFRYQLDKRAGVLIIVQRRLSGRVRGKACVAITTKTHTAKPCSRYVTVTMIAVRNAKAGANQRSYSARSGTSPLAPGRYRVLAAAANSGGWSKLRTAAFTVVRRKVKHLPGRVTPTRVDDA